VAGHPIELGAMRLEGRALEAGAFDDGNAPLQQLGGNTERTLRRHADQRHLHLPQLADVRRHGRVAQTVGQRQRQRFRPAHDAGQFEVGAGRIEDDLGAGPAQAAKPDHRQAQTFHGSPVRTWIMRAAFVSQPGFTRFPPGP
jgi:hypothetical protein